VEDLGCREMFKELQREMLGCYFPEDEEIGEEVEESESQAIDNGHDNEANRDNEQQEL
jgi:hypothetical protein